MLDLKFIRENPELVKKGIESKNERSRVDEVLQLDKHRREILVVSEELKTKRNHVSQKIGKLKKAGQDASAIITEMKNVSDKITEYDCKLSSVEAELNDLLMYIPNLPHSSVLIGKSAENNVEVRRWLPDGFDFEQNEKVYDHIELGKKLRILDFERGAKISGSGFPVYLGKGATLERSLINFMLDYHLQNHCYTEVFPPFLVNRDSMKGTGQLPKMEDDMYFIEKDLLYPIPTAEVPITNLYRNEMLNESDLQIPYRILMLCSADLSFAAAKCYDIETWSPAEKRWLEASSCSTFGDFQARRANIRYRNKATKKPEFVHTLNGSGLATSRLMVSLLENYQTPNGTVLVPEVLRKYTIFSVID